MPWRIIISSFLPVQLAHNQSHRNKHFSNRLRAVFAFGKAFQWQELIDQGVCGSPKDVAKRENAEVTHVYRLMRLTLLAPDIVEAILDGKQPRTLTLQNVVRGFPVSQNAFSW